MKSSNPKYAIMIFEKKNFLVIFVSGGPRLSVPYVTLLDIHPLMKENNIKHQNMGQNALLGVGHVKIM